jgi:lysophospholipase L1-like esterase
MKHSLLFFLCAVSLSSQGRDAVPAIPANAKVAIVGDSITEQKLYSNFIETYLLACAGRGDVHCMQFGWGGERAMGFEARLQNDLGFFGPTVATLCYGMNDGTYVPYQPAIGADYEKHMRSVLQQLPSVGVKLVVAGSPGAVDTKFFAKASANATQYNDNLAHLRDIDKKLATEFKQRFADVHEEMVTAMAKAKAERGEDYDVCGRDGVHPSSNGHLLMAAAFLKALGCDGNIGDITLDMAGQSSVSDGHKIIGGSGAAIEIESINWPFCFDADPKASSSTRSILPFCSFNQDLNRLTLKVKGLTSAKAKVTWGAESKEFTAEQLAAGINLAAEFAKTPFDAAFAGLYSAVATKQGYETPLIKGMITNFRSFADDAKSDPEIGGAISTLKTKLLGKQQKLDAAAHARLVPVKHSLKVEAL